MKTRIVYTKIWKDDWFLDLPDNAQRLFLFFITCEDIGLTGIFELSDREITMRTRLAGNELVETKALLFPKVLFYNAWVCIRNAHKYANYSGAKNLVAFDKEMKLVPQEVREFFKGVIHNKYSIHTLSSGTDTPINHKSETINQNQGMGISQPVWETLKLKGLVS